MADDSTKGLKDNIIKGPWKRVKSVSMAQTQKLSQDMMFCDDVAESVIHIIEAPTHVEIGDVQLRPSEQGI